MLCEAMRAAIPEPLRVELHRAAFEYYRDLRRVPEERRRPRLAFHAAEAGLREPAARAYEALAAEYLYRHRYVEAEASYSRMLALEAWAAVRARSKRCSEEQQAIEVIELQALGALRVGDLAGAKRALREALTVAQGLPNVMEARLLDRLSKPDAIHRRENIGY